MPKHIPLKKEELTKLRGFLDYSLTTIRERREARTQQWRKWQEQYEGKVGPKNFPWKGASNVWVPQTAIDVDAIHANMMNRIFGHDRLWDVTAHRVGEPLGVNPSDGQPIEWRDVAEAFQSYMAFETDPGGMLDVYDIEEDSILECIKLGTSVEYSPWLTLTQPDYVYNFETGEVRHEKDVTTFDGISPQMIPLEDFLILPFYDEIHGPRASPLFGHQYWLRRGELIARAKNGRYRHAMESEEFQTVLGSPGVGGEASATDLKDYKAQLEGDPHVFTDERRGDYLLQDLWVRVQLRDNGVEYRLYITYHQQSGVILACRPFMYNTAPYGVKRYIRREGRFYGIGVPELLETIQKGINTTFNQSVDNATIANMRCFKVQQGTQAARSVGNIYPGKKFVLNRMDELEPFQLGEVYPSIFQIGLNLRDFGERRTGISDFNLGKDTMEHSTASGTLALLQESSRRFDLYSKDIRRSIGELGMQALELIVQHKAVDRVFKSMEPAKATLIEQFIANVPPNEVRALLKVTATSSAQAANKEVERQSAVTVFGLVSQYLEKLIPVAGAITNQQLPPEMRQLFYEVSQMGERVMQRVLNTFDQPELGRDLPQTEGLLNVQQQQAPGANGAGGPMDGSGGVPNAPQAGGGVGFTPEGG